MELLAKTFQGLEEVLAEEIQNIGGSQIQKLTRAVSFEGNKMVLYKANYLLRTAIRVLVKIKEFEANNEDELYDTIYAYKWEELMDIYQTFAIDAVSSSEIFNHSKYLALKSKDALVDRFRDKFGKRPNVNVLNPTHRINIHARGNKVTLLLDSSGDSLHKRGYRMNSVDAPLNEALAAGIILLSGWDGQTKFMDPMCGSGTFLIEAYRIASNRPPQTADRTFGFRKWKNYDEDLWEMVVEEARNLFKNIPALICGSDKSLRSVKVAQINIEEAGLSNLISVEKQNFLKIEADEPYHIIFNPPYDERLKVDDIKTFYREMGDALKHNFPGSTAWVFSGNEEALKSVGLRASKRISLFNGSIPAKLYRYDMWVGSKE